MRTATTFQQAREAAKAFQGRPLLHKATGLAVVASRNNLDKMLSKSAIVKSESPATHCAAVANADVQFGDLGMEQARSQWRFISYSGRASTFCANGTGWAHEDGQADRQGNHQQAAKQYAVHGRSRGFQ